MNKNRKSTDCERKSALVKADSAASSLKEEKFMTNIIINSVKYDLFMEQEPTTGKVSETTITLRSGRVHIAKIHACFGALKDYKESKPDVHSHIIGKNETSYIHEKPFHIGDNDRVVVVDMYSDRNDFSKSKAHELSFDDRKALFDALPDIFRALGYGFNKIAYAYVNVHRKSLENEFDDYVYDRLEEDSCEMLSLIS